MMCSLYFPNARGLIAQIYNRFFSGHCAQTINTTQMNHSFGDSLTEGNLYPMTSQLGVKEVKKGWFICFNLKVPLQRWKFIQFQSYLQNLQSAKALVVTSLLFSFSLFPFLFPLLPCRCWSSINSCTHVSVTEFAPRETDLQPILNKYLLIGCLTEIYLGIKRAVKHTLIIATD